MINKDFQVRKGKKKYLVIELKAFYNFNVLLVDLHKKSIINSSIEEFCRDYKLDSLCNTFHFFKDVNNNYFVLLGESASDCIFANVESGKIVRISQDTWFFSFKYVYTSNKIVRKSDQKISIDD